MYARRDRPGAWVAEVEVNGKRHRSYFPNEKAARLGLDKLRVEAGAVTREEQESLRAWLTHWAEVVVPRQVERRRLEPKTALYYQGVVRNQWLRSPLANEALSAVGPAQIEAALEEMIASVSRTTVSHARAVLSAAYNAAVRDGRAPGNPVASTKLRNVPGRPVPNRARRLPVSRDLARAISDAVADTSDRAVIGLMLNAGLRPAEALAIRWGDVTLAEPMTVRVRQAVKQVGGRWQMGTPKTDLSTRDISLDAAQAGIRPVLYQQSHRLEKQLGRKLQTDDLLFPAPSGGMDNPVSLSRRFKKTLAEAGIGDFTPRDLRTLHASLLVSDGVDIATVSRRLGHSDPVTTWRRYIGVPTKSDQAAAAVGTLWERARRPKEDGDTAPAGDRSGRDSAGS